jgi:SPP1 gp7 family putative phage head morphogenesis protein
MRRSPPRLASRAARRKATLAIHRGLTPAENGYVRALRGVAAAVHREYMKALAPYLEDIAGKADGRRDAHTSLSNEFDILGVRVQAAIGPTVGPLFDKMSKQVVVSNAKGQALLGIKVGTIAGNPGVITNATGGIQGDIAAARDRNIRLVEDAQRAYAQQVRDIVEDPGTFGMRVEDIQEALEARGGVSGSRAELIARDQTLKLNGQISATRQQRAGVESYTWSTSLDDRVRDEHAELEGQQFDWLNPPEVGHPGEDINCRCVAIPVIAELDDLFSDDTQE